MFHKVYMVYICTCTMIIHVTRVMISMTSLHKVCLHVCALKKKLVIATTLLQDIAYHGRIYLSHFRI